MRVSAKPPYFTRFRRRVRWEQWLVSSEVPFAMAQDQMRRDLNERKHTVDEASWRDQPGYYTVGEMRGIVAGERRADRRTVSVRYVTGGMRHGLGERIELQPQISVIEFARAHNLPKPPPLAPDEEIDLD